MYRALTLGLLAVLLTLPRSALAQDGRLQMELRQPPVPARAARASVVLPAPPPAAAARDAERAADEVAARERAAELLREQGVPGVRPARRPDLDPDVVGGIQSRVLQRALRR